MLHDVAIVGAGPVGATLALALAGDDLDIVVLDARAEGEAVRGDRSLALSHGARLILERFGVWQELAAERDAVTPIEIVDISQAGGFGVTRLEAADHGLPALGYVVAYRALQAALDRLLAKASVAIRHGVTANSAGGTSAYAAVALADGEPVLARLAAVADGTGASVAGLRRRRHDYAQVALVARVWRDEPHRGLAYERFTAQGPVALLPEADHYSLIWTATPHRAEELLAQDDATFLASLASHFGARVGNFTRVAARRMFALALEVAPATFGTRTVVLGNAAQTLHPVAGQGFNVGLRDAMGLARTVLDTPRETIGERAMLSRYAASRRVDRWSGIAFTHGLVRVFGNDEPFVRWPRGIALTLLDVLPPAKRAFTRAMMFGVR